MGLTPIATVEDYLGMFGYARKRFRLTELVYRLSDKKKTTFIGGYRGLLKKLQSGKEVHDILIEGEKDLL